MALLELSSGSGRSCCLMTQKRDTFRGLIFGGFVQARTGGLKSPPCQVEASIWALLPVGKQSWILHLNLKGFITTGAGEAVPEEDGSYRNTDLVRLESTSANHLIHLPCSKQAQPEQGCEQAG